MDQQNNTTEDTAIVLTENKSAQLAFFIQQLAPWIAVMDVDYMKEIIRTMLKDASFQDSASVLNRNYDPAVTQLMRKQAEALQNLVNYIEALKDCNAMKTAIGKNSDLRDQIESLFYHPTKQS